jgi:predicted metal-dependent hydrolase
MVTSPELEVRNRRFATGPEVPRHWHGGRRSVTIFFDNLSLFFPAGESFFVVSVKRYRRRIRDERLARDVAAFCAQEGVHRREHARYNEMIAARGGPAAALESGVVRLVARVARVLPVRSQLAVTCALEHFTATLAHAVLRDDCLLEGAHPTMAALWRWHAAEETEHKAVAFDVYREIGGGYLERVVMMILASLVFWAKILQHQVKMMKAEGILFSAEEWRSLIRFLWVDLRMRDVARLYLQYYRPSFHPWDHDDRHLLDRWKQGSVAQPA